MDAVISGTANRAILVDDDGLWMITEDPSHSPVSVDQGFVHRFMNGYSDLQFVENRSLSDIQAQLRVAKLQSDGLNFCLMSLDASFPESLRIDLARQANNMMNEGIEKHLLNVLYAHPLPHQADIGNVLSYCKVHNLLQLLAILEDVIAHQSAIRLVHLSWNANNPTVFGRREEFMRFQKVVVEEGLFRDLVLISRLALFSSFLDASFQNPNIVAFAFYREALRAWVALLYELLKSYAV